MNVYRVQNHTTMDFALFIQIYETIIQRVMSPILLRRTKQELVTAGDCLVIGNNLF